MARSRKVPENPPAAPDVESGGDLEFIRFLANHWGKIATLLTIAGGLITGGYWLGSKVTKMEYETEKNSILNEKNKEIMDIREKYINDRLDRSESIQKETVRIYDSSADGKEVKNEK